MAAGCTVIQSEKAAALTFQTAYNWKQKILLGAGFPRLLGIKGSILSFVCVCAYVFMLAFTQTQEQTCLSEAAAEPGWGVKAAARAGKEVWVACCKREPKVIFHDVAEEINIYHRLALSLGRCTEERNLNSPTSQMFMPFHFFQSL